MQTTAAALSIAGNFCISLGFQFQRLHPDPCASFLWWCGCALMLVGETSNFIAYGLAPASLVAPLDAVAIISNALLSRIALKERLSRAGIAGVAAVIIGVTAMVVSAPTTIVEKEGERPYASIESLSAVAFISGGCVAAIWVSNQLDAPHQTKHSHLVRICFLCAWMGTLTVVVAKSLSAALRHAMVSGSTAMFDDPQICWLTYLLVSAMAGSIALQMKFLHAAFNEFGSGLVISMYYALFSGMAVLAGMIVFQEPAFTQDGRRAALFASGLAFALAGVLAVGQDDTSLYMRTEFDQRFLTRVVVVKKGDEVQ